MRCQFIYCSNALQTFLNREIYLIVFIERTCFTLAYNDSLYCCYLDDAAGFESRFQKEANLSSSAIHPSVVKVIICHVRHVVLNPYVLPEFKAFL